MLFLVPSEGEYYALLLHLALQDASMHHGFEDERSGKSFV